MDSPIIFNQNQNRFIEKRHVIFIFKGSRFLLAKTRVYYKEGCKFKQATLQGANTSVSQNTFQDDFPCPKPGRVSPRVRVTLSYMEASVVTFDPRSHHLCPKCSRGGQHETPGGRVGIPRWSVVVMATPPFLFGLKITGMPGSYQLYISHLEMDHI